MYVRLKHALLKRNSLDKSTNVPKYLTVSLCKQVVRKRRKTSEASPPPPTEILLSCSKILCLYD